MVSFRVNGSPKQVAARLKKKIDQLFEVQPSVILSESEKPGRTYKFVSSTLYGILHSFIRTLLKIYGTVKPATSGTRK